MKRDNTHAVKRILLLGIEYGERVVVYDTKLVSWEVVCAGDPSEAQLARRHPGLAFPTRANSSTPTIHHCQFHNMNGEQNGDKDNVHQEPDFAQVCLPR